MRHPSRMVPGVGGTAADVLVRKELSAVAENILVEVVRRHTFCNVDAAIFPDRIEDPLVFHLENCKSSCS